ncbi:MAG: DivIVA domain-containing protein [Motilibacteraceae bacterium]
MARNRDRFPRATGMSKGYRREQVDGWLNRVETAMRLTDGMPTVSSAEVRRVGFDLVRRGYDVAAVDAHLDRLEELAVAAETEAEVSVGRLADPVAGVRDADRLAHELQAPDGERFAHAPLLTRGYDPRDVDAFVEEVLLPGLTGAAPLPAADQVRSVVFRARRGGYDEGAVDDALDAVVDHLLRRDRVGAGFVPSYAGSAPEPALQRRSPEPAQPSPAAPRAVDPDDAWAVDGWLPEPHRAAPVSPSGPAAAGIDADEQPTQVWPGGLPVQAAGEPGRADRDDSAVAPLDGRDGDDEATSRARSPRRTSTGTGWPSS